MTGGGRRKICWGEQIKKRGWGIGCTDGNAEMGRRMSRGDRESVRKGGGKSASEGHFKENHYLEKKERC